MSKELYQGALAVLYQIGNDLQEEDVTLEKMKRKVEEYAVRIAADIGSNLTPPD